MKLFSIKYPDPQLNLVSEFLIKFSAICWINNKNFLQSVRIFRHNYLGVKISRYKNTAVKLNIGYLSSIKTRNS